MKCKNCEHYDQNSRVPLIGWCKAEKANTEKNWYCLKYKGKSKPRKITDKIKFAKIIKSVCEVFQYEKQDIESLNRKGSLSDARAAFYYLAKKYTENTLISIANYVNRSDHTTVIHGIRKIHNYLSYDKEFESKINECIKLIEA